MAESGKHIFCANCQQVTIHTAKMDSNGEFVFTCASDGCGRFLKFPSDTTPDKFYELVAKQEEANAGQVSLAKQEEALNEILATPEPGEE